MASRAPFSRQRDREAGRRDAWGLARAAEFAAATYGWSPDYIESRLTDEQLVAALDAAQERISDEARARFTEATEAARIGAIFAQDAKQYSRWRAEVDRRSPRGATKGGKDLAQLARDFGGAAPGGLAIVRGGLEFRDN